MSLRTAAATCALFAVTAAPLAIATAPQAQAAPVRPAATAAKGNLKTTANVHLRSGLSTRTKSLVVLSKGTVIASNGKARGIWQPVEYKGRTGYVSSRYLVRTTAAPKSTSTAKRSVTSSAPRSRVSMPSGVNANGRRVASHVANNHAGITTIYGYRNERGSDHGTGRAVDVMIPNYRSNQALGWSIATDLRNNASQLGITYIIWDQKIWSVQRDREGWRHMSNRGSDNANHKNHVHVSVR